MRHDDRLATVLAARADAPAMARIQWRQLIDLIGTAPSDARTTALDEGYVRLATLAKLIPAEARARILSEPDLRLRSPRLVAQLALDDAAVARAALLAADLSHDAWADLIPALPPAQRAMLHERGDLGADAQRLLSRLGVGSRGLPLPEGMEVPAAAPTSSPIVSTADTVVSTPATEAAPTTATPPAANDGIGAIVRRIEAFRQARAAQSGASGTGGAAPAIADSPRLPLDDQPAPTGRGIVAFDFITDVDGRITWSDATVAPMVVGLSLASLSRSGRASEIGTSIGALLRRHQPLRAVAVTLTGAHALVGSWQLDAVARFDTAGGRFAGYAGRLRRLADVAAETASDTPSVRESDRLRQLLHELRTPVNAIQGFAEVIQQQLFGPAPHEYRALAAGIAADAARMLAGFEELERYARLETGAETIAAGSTDMGESLTTLIDQLAPGMERRGARFELTPSQTPLTAALAPADAERLCWRMLATLAAHAGEGEVMPIHAESVAVTPTTALAASREVRMALHLPKALAALDEAAFFRAEAARAKPGEAGAIPSLGMFGSGFALRLAVTEARAAGGTLRRDGDWLLLTLPAAALPVGDVQGSACPAPADSPGLTAPAPGHSEDATHARAAGPWA